MASAASPSATNPKMADLCNHTAQASSYLVGQWLGFCWFLGWQTSDTRLARRKLGKKINPDYGGRRRPMAAMAPRPRR